MAQLVGVLNTSHIWIGRPPEQWDAVRQSRRLRADVPTDTLEERVVKAARVAAAVQQLKDKLEEMRPDALVIFGDDQSENFPSPEIRVMPQIAIYCGEDYYGIAYDNPKAGPVQKAINHAPLAKAILKGLIDRDFDPAYCLTMPNPEVGIGHAIINPLGYFTDYSIPTVPILLNAIYAPSLTGRRCVRLGHAVRQIIEEYPEDLRVVAIGSGGLWHTTSAPETWLNEEFDRVGMEYLTAGDIAGWASHFDSYVVEDDDVSQKVTVPSRGSSGLDAMPGPQLGTREELDWIAASAAAEGSPFVVADMVQIYSSPIDCTFAYCDDVRPLKFD